MPSLTDPTKALLSLQRHLQSRSLVMQPGEIDPTIKVHVDQPNGELRITYAYLVDNKVAAIAILTPSDPIEKGVACFGIGYAVHRDFRGQGLGKKIVRAAIDEFQHGMARNELLQFYIEAVVGIDNIPSQHVAAATVSPSPKPGVDKPSGAQVLQYVRKVQSDALR